MNTPFGDLFSKISQLQEFQRNFQGNPGQQVQQMLNSGQMSQEQ